MSLGDAVRHALKPYRPLEENERLRRERDEAREKLVAAERSRDAAQSMLERSISPAVRQERDNEDMKSRLSAIAEIAADHEDGAEDATPEEKAFNHIHSIARGDA